MKEYQSQFLFDEGNEESEPATVARGKKRANDDSSEEEAPTKGKAQQNTTQKKAKIWKKGADTDSDKDSIKGACTR